MKLRIFWDVLPCSLLNFDRCFRGTCCLHHQGDETHHPDDSSIIIKSIGLRRHSSALGSQDDRLQTQFFNINQVDTLKTPIFTIILET
jgi:hypothetical protein